MNTQETSENGLMTKAEAARALKICKRSVENLMAARRLSFIRIGRAVRIEKSAIEALKKSLTVEAIN